MSPTAPKNFLAENLPSLLRFMAANLHPTSSSAVVHGLPQTPVFKRKVSVSAVRLQVGPPPGKQRATMGPGAVNVGETNESAGAPDFEAFADDVEAHNIDRADEKFRNRQAKKGQSAILSDTAFDDDVEQFNIERSAHKAQHLKDQGMTVADLSDHDTIDDPVEVFNVENAAVKKKKRDEMNEKGTPQHPVTEDW